MTGMKDRSFRQWCFALAILTVGACLIARPFFAAAGEPLTADEIAKLEPELCKQGSSFFRSMTAALPSLLGSVTTDMSPEQIALVEQYKASGRRKVWVLRLPAAFISERTCDAGRSNWSGEGDYIEVDQLYRLAVLVLGDRMIPVSRATAEDLQAGISVDVRLHNRVRDPTFLHSIHKKDVFVFGRVGSKGPPTCREEESDIPGLVIFRRIDPNVRDPLDCEGDVRKRVFASKVDDSAYDFVAFCWVNCRVDRDHQGWDVRYSYPYAHLSDWQQLHASLERFLDQHTVYLDHDSGNP